MVDTAELQFLSHRITFFLAVQKYYLSVLCSSIAARYRGVCLENYKYVAHNLCRQFLAKQGHLEFLRKSFLAVGFPNPNWIRSLRPHLISHSVPAARCSQDMAPAESRCIHVSMLWCMPFFFVVPLPSRKA